ncbi:MAG: carbohydrate binding family 9 domain-containing protein, partial [Fidelibacterota bacterium]
MQIRGTLSLLLLITILSGGENKDIEIPDLPPSLEALRINSHVRVDGYLEDEGWQQAQYASNFTQRDPLEGETATERTEFAILYDDEYLYVGIKAYDSDPDGIRSILSRRDEEIPSDWVHVSFDSYNDHRTAFEFWLNPLGVKRDLRRYDDENHDMNWDAIWEGKAAIQEDGWSAEFRIPFRELRFSNGENHAWGLQVYRYISRKNEDDFWSFWPKDETGWVRHYGRLNNLKDIPRQRRIYFAPYSTGRFAAAKDYKTPVHPETYDLGSNLGADLKVGITNNLTLDLTLNPDFGQVEADPAELNISG